MNIRHSVRQDIPAIRDIYAQPSCYAETLQLPFPSLQQWEKFLNDIPDNFFSLVAEIDGQIVGQIGMEVYARHRRKHAANIGMAVAEAHQGKGIGSALLASIIEMATGWLAVRRLELEVYTDNHSAIALYKKHGFVVEGTAKAYAFRDGKYADVLMMARISN